jgi:hypothetical protein
MGPPNPAIPSSEGPVKDVSAIASPISTSSASNLPPLLISGFCWLLSLTNSGLGSPEGICGSLNARGKLRALGLWGSL